MIGTCPLRENRTSQILWVLTGWSDNKSAVDQANVCFTPESVAKLDGLFRRERLRWSHGSRFVVFAWALPFPLNWLSSERWCCAAKKLHDATQVLRGGGQQHFVFRSA
jgi:hypothetical protein